MNCPYCKISSMDAVASGEVEVDRCRTCGEAWFDPGEIRELTQVGPQQLSVPVMRGRWWIDSQGNTGVEGNPAPICNIYQFSRGKGGAYQRSTAGGYIGGDGNTSYFFDPKSGSSVMVGN